MAGVMSHRVTLLGREFQVKSPAPPERVSEIEQFVNSRLTEVAASLAGSDVQSVASLTLLNLADEYLALREEYNKFCNEDSDKLERLIGRLESCR
jgi:cell division protein ZapA